VRKGEKGGRQDRACTFIRDVYKCTSHLFQSCLHTLAQH
jgi:hypothetical protein